MDSRTERFVNEQNISRFADGFGRETDPERRRVLKDLLLLEEHRLGSTSWHVELVEAHIAQARSRIEQQESIIAGGKLGERELTQARILLQNYQELAGLFREFRRFLVQVLDRAVL